MEKPDWVLWGDAQKIVTLEQCVCLALDADPFQPPKPSLRREFSGNPNPQGEPWAAPVVVWSGDHLSQQERNERLAFTHEALLSPEGVKKLAKLRQHFDEGQPLLQPMGRYRQDQKRVVLYDFAHWAHAMKWSVPEPLDLTPTPTPQAVPVVQAGTVAAPMVTPPEPQAAPMVKAPASETTEPPAPPVVAVGASGGDEPWKEQARARAYEIIKRDKAKDLYPNQLNIADEIAKQFRRDGLTGADGKPLAGTSIKRHALKGISSAQSKLVSTVMRQSK